MCDPPLSPRDVDGLFRRVMREYDVGLLTRWLLWLGVRYGALANPVRRPGIARDLPLMVALTALVLAGTAAVVYGADRIAHWLLGGLL